MHFIAFLKKKLSKMAPILTGDTEYQRFHSALFISFPIPKVKTFLSAFAEDHGRKPVDECGVDPP